FSAVSTGRVRSLEQPPSPGVEARLPVVQPLLEIAAEFELDRDEIDAVSRGNDNPNLDPLIHAARRPPVAEERIIVDRHPTAGWPDLIPGAPKRVSAGGGEDILRAVSDALEPLREAGVDGPYALALGPKWYTDLARIPGAGRYPLIEHVRKLIEGPIVWAPAL